MNSGMNGRINSSVPLFAVRRLRVRFQERTALSVDELDFEEGGVTVLVGENGSGKTTLLRILNGLISPEAGTVEFRGLPMTAEGRARVRAESVLVHQSPLLFRGSVGYNVRYGIRLKGAGREEAEEKASSALRRAGLDGFERRPVSSLSGGERQRVALARGFAVSPRVFLLDEPTANVDAASQGQVEDIIREMAASGTTIIMSTHNAELAYRLSDRIVRLDRGVPAEVDENLLRGVVEKTDEQFAYFRTGEALLRCPARQGSFVVAVLPCDEIILCPRPLESSARNQLRGVVSSIQPFGNLLRVTVSCGVPLKAIVTRESAAELGVEPGAACVVTFKASAVRLY
jgi:molybdopterin-binding protein